MKLLRINTALAIAILLAPYRSNAQSAWCGSTPPSQQWEKELQDLVKSAQGDQKLSQNQTITIPVIVHIIYGSQSVGNYPNLSGAQVASQIRSLNEDFGGVGFNYSSYPATAFSGWANTSSVSAGSLDNLGRIRIANCNVQFCLAAADTMGNPLTEPGIDRVSYVARNWANPASFTSYNSFKNFIDGTVKPGTIWDVTKYFNIWVSDESINAIGLLGYATFPPLSQLQGLSSGPGTSTTDGVWCYARAFGSANTFPSSLYTSGNNYGRTMTHEAGHWLGLRHVWGDGSCANDYCDDTPLATASNFGNPAYPFKVGNCNPNSPDGEMFMNFMDYTNDQSKYMFTVDQANRVQTAMTFSPYRKFLGTHNLCSVLPVPATSKFSLISSVCEGNTVIAVSQSSGVPAPSYTWSGSNGIVFLPDAHDQNPAVTFPAGGGVFDVTLTVSNGSQAFSVKTITVNPLPVIQFLGNITPQSANNLSLCAGDEATVFLSGGNTYTWMPGGSQDPFYAYTALNDETYTVSATGEGNCKSSQVINFTVDMCTAISDHAFVGMSVYPNPFTGKLHVDLSRDGVTQVSLRDALGRELLSSQVHPATKSIELRTLSLQPGVYFLRLDSQQGKRVVKVIKE
jgi:hypothetical protein